MANKNGTFKKKKQSENFIQYLYAIHSNKISNQDNGSIILGDIVSLTS